MAPPIRLLVPDVARAAEWYARTLDGELVSTAPDRAELRLGAEGLPLLLESGTPPPPSTTPVRELRVQGLAEWVAAALDAGATRATPASLESYAQVRDPFGYLWAFAERPALPR